MRLALLTLMAVLAGGCGAATTVPGSSAEEPTLAAPTVATEADEPDPKPPAIFLITSAGKQRALEGSYCVEYTNHATGESVGSCADAAGPLTPMEMTVVQPGDDVIVALPGATLKQESTLTVRPLGCTDQETRTIDLPAGGELHWRVDLEPGPYQLDVFALFDADNGLSGDASGTLGMLVGDGPKKYDDRGVVAVDEALAVCPFQP